jgi:hypothetical protein
VFECRQVGLAVLPAVDLDGSDFYPHHSAPFSSCCAASACHDPRRFGQPLRAIATVQRLRGARVREAVGQYGQPTL